MSGNSDKSKSTRIPVQTQITPEMEQKLEQQALAKELFYRRLFFYRNLGIALLVVGLPITIVAYFKIIDRIPNTVDSASSETVKPLDSLELLLKNGSDFKLEEYSSRLDEDVTKGTVPTQVAALKNRLRIADELERRGAESSSTYASVSKISALIKLTTINVITDLHQPSFSLELMQFCNSNLDNPDSKIRARANVGLLVARIHDYLLDNSDENFEAVTRTVDNFPMDLTSELLRAKEVSSLASGVARSNRPDHVREFRLRFGNRLKQSDDPTIRQRGINVHDEIVTGDIDFLALRRMVLIRNRDSLIKLEDLVGDVCNSPFLSSMPYQKVLSILELLRQVNEEELAELLIEKLRGSIDAISDDSTRQEVMEMLVNYEKRQSLRGSVFKLSQESSSEPNLARGDQSTVVLFFSTRDLASRQWIVRLQEMVYDIKADIRCVLVCVDNTVDEAGTIFLAEVAKRFPDALVVRHPESAWILKQYSIQPVPYLLIVDKNSRVSATNVDIDNVRKLISQD